MIAPIGGPHWGVVAATASGDLDGRKVLLDAMSREQLEEGLLVLAMLVVAHGLVEAERRGSSDPAGDVGEQLRAQILGHERRRDRGHD